MVVVASAFGSGCASAPDASPDTSYRLVEALSASDSAAAQSTLRDIRALPDDLFAVGERNDIRVSAGVFVGSNGTPVSYRLLPPANADPERSYPLVVVFHGAGEMGTDNLRQFDAFPKTWARPDIRDRFPAYVLAPQMPERSALYSGPAGTPGRYSRPGPPLDAALDLIESVIERHAVDPDRVYAVGFSMGASTTWNALVLRPDLFAAAIAIAGVPPNPARRHALAKTPLWIVHGNADTANPIGPDRTMYELVRAVPGADVQFWEFDQMHHGVPLRLLTGDEMMTWLFSHGASGQ